jgi:putative PIG3 family NAD(P)H quinone oxidoreductase
MKYLDARVEGDGYRVALAEAPIPAPGGDEVLVRVAASGVNRADLSQIAGAYPPPPGEPEILGLELAGVVVETGEKVCALVAGGGHAEYAAVPRGQILPAPLSLDLASTAALPEAFLTAYLNLAIEGELREGEAALVHAGASGVGLAAIQTAKYLGARVAATTRSASKLEAMRQAGADLATLAESFASVIEEAWGAGAIHVILDPVGARTLADDLRVLALGGRIVFLATMSGGKAELDIARLMARRGRLIGSTLRSRPRAEKARLVARFREEVLPGFDSGALSVSIDSMFPPRRAAEAFERMKQNRNVGKILIDWSGRA